MEILKVTPDLCYIRRISLYPDPNCAIEQQNLY